MAKQTYWLNEDGLEVGYGPVVGENKHGASQHVKGKIKQAQLNVDVASGYPTVGTALTSKNIGIPANAYIVSARYVSEVDFDEAVEFGTADIAGVAIDQDGLVATGTGTAEGAGAQIGTVVSEVAYLVVTPTTNAPTEGKGQLIVEYII